MSKNVNHRCFNYNYNKNNKLITRFGYDKLENIWFEFIISLDSQFEGNAKLINYHQVLAWFLWKNHTISYSVVSI